MGEFCNLPLTLDQVVQLQDAANRAAMTVEDYAKARLGLVPGICRVCGRVDKAVICPGNIGIACQPGPFQCTERAGVKKKS